MATTAEDKTGARKVYKDHNLHVLFGITLMAVLGVSSITPALPEVRDAFGVTSGQVGLLITVFTLPGIALTPILGVLSDRHGRRKILTPALLLFGIAGGLRAFARSFELLLALRLVQGMGAAALGALNVTVIGDIYAGRERSAALGYNSSVLSSASLTTALVSSQLGNLTGWFSEKTLLKVAFILYAIALFAVSLAPSLWLLTIPAVLFGVAQGINIPNVFSLLNDHAPTENRGAFIATNGMALRTGQTIGPLLMATATATFGLTGAYLAAAALAVAGFALILTLVR